MKNKSETVRSVPTRADDFSWLITFPASSWSLVPDFPAFAEIRSMIETEAILGRASPLKPKVRIRKRSLSSLILLVAWRLKARRISASSIPSPLSKTRIFPRPASSTSISMIVLCASMAFSTNSFTTEAGRSTTSPAAILLERKSSNSIISGIVHSHLSPYVISMHA